LVLHPRFKFEYFDDNWKDTPRFISTARTKLKKLWMDEYRPELGRVAQQSPEPEPVKISYIETILNKRSRTGTVEQIPKPLRRKDELDLYLKEPPTSKVRVIEYWKIHEPYWPNLT
jgi:hypothetical protein